MELRPRAAAHILYMLQTAFTRAGGEWWLPLNRKRGWQQRGQIPSAVLACSSSAAC